jgi:hypothetical protein
VFLTLCHMLACCSLSFALSLGGSFPIRHLKSRRQMGKVALLALIFCVTIVLGNLSLKHIAVSFNQAVGAATPFFTAVFALMLQGARQAAGPLRARRAARLPLGRTPAAPGAAAHELPLASTQNRRQPRVVRDVRDAGADRGRRDRRERRRAAVPHGWLRRVPAGDGGARAQERRAGAPRRARGRAAGACAVRGPGRAGGGRATAAASPEPAHAGAMRRARRMRRHARATWMGDARARRRPCC